MRAVTPAAAADMALASNTPRMAVMPSTASWAATGSFSNCGARKSIPGSSFRTAVPISPSNAPCIRNILLLAAYAGTEGQPKQPTPEDASHKASAQEWVDKAAAGLAQATGALLCAVELALCLLAAFNLNVNLNFVVTGGHLCCSAKSAYPLCCR